MERFDPTAAFFGGITSIWGRMILFFLTAFTAHGLGLISAYTVAGEPFSIDLSLGNIAGLPLSFLWQILQNFIFPWGLLYVLLLGVCFWLILFTDVLPIISVSTFGIIQVWDTFFLQRAIASKPSFFYRMPDFSEWGYVFAGGFSLLAAIMIALPFILPLLPKGRIKLGS